MARDAIEQIDLTLRLVESYPETFQLVNGPDEVKGIYDSGKIACSIGIEGYATLYGPVFDENFLISLRTYYWQTSHGRK